MSKETLRELDPSEVPNKFPRHINSPTFKGRTVQRNMLGKRVEGVRIFTRQLGLHLAADSFNKAIIQLRIDQLDDKQATSELREKL
jgi:hypothetical protein